MINLQVEARADPLRFRQHSAEVSAEAVGGVEPNAADLSERLIEIDIDVNTDGFDVEFEKFD